MEDLLEFIRIYATLSGVELELLKQHVFIEHIKAKSYILKQGKICNRISYISEGVVRFFIIDENGTEITNQFYNESHFVLDSVSYQNRTPSTKNIQAVTDCKMLIISTEADSLFAEKINNWDTIKRTITVDAFTEKFINTSNLLHNDAQTRYLNFMKQYPDIVQRVPLGQLASYLGITQQSLSRIRKQIFS
jgi:CRP-like cAMP-binding protein